MSDLRDLQSHGPIPRHNDPTKTIAQRLWDKAIETDEGCWTWRGAVNSKGYGTTTKVKTGPGRAPRAYAHRMAWEVFNGPIPDGLYVDHVCHNRRCINPEHLRLATPAQNLENRAGAQYNSKTGHRNVYPLPDGRFAVQVRHRHVGVFDDLVMAVATASEYRRQTMPFSEMDRVS